MDDSAYKKIAYTSIAKMLTYMCYENEEFSDTVIKTISTGINEKDC